MNAAAKPKILTALPRYTPALFRADLMAGIPVAMGALALSIAIASGPDAATGLTTAFVGEIPISAPGGSRVQAGGPTGACILVVYGVIAEHGHDGLVLATLMAGGILGVVGHFRVGSHGCHIPRR